MAKIISSDAEPRLSIASFSIYKSVVIGFVLGIVYWYLSGLLIPYVDSGGVASGISTILVATLGIAIMLRWGMAQPVIIAVASGISLWGLAEWTAGLGLVETIAWIVFLYVLAYSLFSWITRYVKPIPTVTAVLVIVIAARIASVL